MARLKKAKEAYQENGLSVEGPMQGPKRGPDEACVCVWGALRRMLNHIQDEADGLLGEGRDQIIIPSLLPVDAVNAKTALGQHKPANRLVHPESWQFEAVEVNRPCLL
jgi:hypothetical protein